MKQQLYLMAGTVWLWLALGLSCSAQESISVDNTSQYTGERRWAWTIFITASPEALNKIRCVVYTLHETFPNPVRQICQRGTDPQKAFPLAAEGWGTFEVLVKVIFKDGKTQELKHTLKFATPRVDKSFPIKVDNTATELANGWWEWTIFITAPSSVLNEIKCVEYTLHETFSKPLREVCKLGADRQKAFPLTAHGWGPFSVPVKILFKDGKAQYLTHQLDFP